VRNHAASVPATEDAARISLCAAAPNGVDVALARDSSKGGEAMSQAGVGTVIEKLLTDENLRIRFALNRIETVAELCLRGVDLTGDEVDLFCWTNPDLWFLGEEVRSEW
jgi:hypothetical protein